MLQIGELFAGRYEVLAKAGEGGMGSVYRVRDTELNAICALKLLSADLVSDPEGKTRFVREGQAMSRIEHKSVARIFRIGIDGYPYIVMEYVEGESVRRMIQTHDRLSVESALQIMIQVCEGMSAVHEENILHRDLKPDNIMILAAEENATTGTAKIVDFGLARIKSSELAKSQHLTQTGALVGSVHYMSPEQCAGQRTDERGDIYALGCVLYECLTGHPPFTAESPIGLLHKHCNEAIPSILDKLHVTEANRSLDAVISKALSKKSSERYQSMRDFRDDLAACLHDEKPRFAVLKEKTTFRKGAKLRVLVAVLVPTVLLFVLVLATTKLTKPAAVSETPGLQTKYREGYSSVTIAEIDNMQKHYNRFMTLTAFAHRAGRAPPSCKESWQPRGQFVFRGWVTEKKLHRKQPEH